MKAVLMAGGEGSRLRPLTINRPKPMVPIVNRPVMEHCLLLLRKHGITDVIVTLQYMAAVIQDYFGDGSSLGMNLIYSIEDEPLGTAGSVKKAQEHLTDTFIVISADALTDFDLSSIVKSHRKNRAIATLTLHRVENPLEYGVVITDEGGRIKQFLEKPSWGEVFSDTVNTGLYVLEPSIFDYYPSDKAVDFSQDVFPQLLERGDRLYGFVADGYWCDVGNLSEYMRANVDLLEGRVKAEPIGIEIRPGVWAASEDVEIAPNVLLEGPIFLGESVKIQNGAVIRGPTVIRDNALIDERVRIERSIIWRNTFISDRAEVRGAIIGRQCAIKSRAMIFEGAVIGDQTTIGEGAIVQPGVKVWPNKEIEAGATVSSSLIWGSYSRRALFGRWGITGLVDVDMTPEFAARIGATYGSTLPKGSTVIVNRDAHRAPRMIKRALISGLPSAGVNVIDVKSQPTPVLRYITRVQGAAGGVHVRVAPHDAKVVDISFFDHRGLDIDGKAKRKIEGVYFREDVRRAYLDDIGVITESPGLVNRYLEGFAKAINAEVFQRIDRQPVVIDYSHSPAAHVLPAVLSRLGCDAIALNADPDERRLTRTRDQIETSLNQLSSIVASIGARMGVRLDPSGERLIAFDERGRRIGSWELLAVVATLVLRGAGGGNIAVPVNAPTIFERIVSNFGGTVVRTKVDPTALMSAGVSKGVLLAGGGQGGIAFPEFQPALDALYATVKIQELLLTQETSLAEEVNRLPQFHAIQTRVTCPWENKGRVMRMLSQQYQGSDTTQIDGIRIDLSSDEWVLVLPDAERPLFHIFAESSSNEGAHTLAEKYSALVASLQR